MCHPEDRTVQLHLYVPDALDKAIRRAATRRGLPVSRYLAEVVRREVAAEVAAGWPEGFFTEVVGGWQGTPLAREAQGEAEPREDL